MTTTAPAAKQRSLAARLGSVHVGLREDLEVSRHVFRGVPSYLVRDPLTFQTQRMSLDDYTVFCSLSDGSGRPLSAVFEEQVSQQRLGPDDEERFYQFIVSLHQLGFLRLPLSDHAMVYRRFQAKQRAVQKQRWARILFFRVPLWNPDAFLSGTARFAAPLFHRACFALWLGLVASAAFVLFQQWDRLHQPLEHLLAAQNVPLLWLTLVLLKAFHEFGHAYACKHFGGHVPEMGAYLILFTPCAYVDATASWGFSSKRHRIIVSLAGMYVESLFAAAAVWVWALTDPSWVHSIAYNVMFLAGVVTVLFNANPLMRYDGYYVLSDVLEIANLRDRAFRRFLSLVKRCLLGLRESNPSGDRRSNAWLLAFGAGATVYRVGLLFGIAALLSTWMYPFGLAVAAAFLGHAWWKSIRRLMQYLWHSPETAPVRGRAMAVGAAVLVLIPACLVTVPLPRTVYVPAVLGREHEVVLRAPTSGFLAEQAVNCQEPIAIGDSVARMQSDEAWESWAEAAAQLESARFRLEVAQAGNPSAVLEEQARIVALEATVQARTRELADMNIQAPIEGTVVDAGLDDKIGDFLPKGTPLATIARGGWQARGFLTDGQLARARPAAGTLIEFRPHDRPGVVWRGCVQRVAPAAQPFPRGEETSRSPHQPYSANVLTPGRGDEPFHEIEVAVWPPDSEPIRHGVTGTIRIQGSAEPLAFMAARSLRLFYYRLSAG